jgi:predicted O-methyltransferase YrrM
VSRLKLALEYAKYYFTAQTKFDVHSPFVYSFITEVLNDETAYPQYKTIDDLNSLNKSNNTIIKDNDLGAGSQFSKSNKGRSAKEIFNNTAVKPKYARLLFRICNYFKPVNIIELGTGFGTSSCSMALASNKSKVTTIEGNDSIAFITGKHFEQLQLNNIVLHKGNFDVVLPSVLNSVKNVDLAFIDGNHQKEKTLKYYRIIAAKCHNNSVIIFDDIRWSDGMLEAWHEIITDPKVTLSFDLFRIGIVFFRSEQKIKEHFVLKY